MPVFAVSFQEPGSSLLVDLTRTVARRCGSATGRGGRALLVSGRSYSFPTRA